MLRRLPNRISLRIDSTGPFLYRRPPLVTINVRSSRLPPAVGTCRYETAHSCRVVLFCVSAGRAAHRPTIGPASAGRTAPASPTIPRFPPCRPPATSCGRPKLPGNGHSSPVIWGDKIFLTSATDEPPQRVVVCLNATDGKILWERRFDYTVHNKHTAQQLRLADLRGRCRSRLRLVVGARRA